MILSRFIWDYQLLEDTERLQLEAKPRLSKVGRQLEGSLGWQARQFVQWRFGVSKYDLQHHEAFPMDSWGGLRIVLITT